MTGAQFPKSACLFFLFILHNLLAWAKKTDQFGFLPMLSFFVSCFDRLAEKARTRYTL